MGNLSSDKISDERDRVLFADVGSVPSLSLAILKSVLFTYYSWHLTTHPASHAPPGAATDEPL